MENTGDNHVIRKEIQEHLPPTPHTTTIFLHGHSSAYDAAPDIVAPPCASDDAGQAVTSPAAFSSMVCVAPDDASQAGITPLAHAASMPSDGQAGTVPSSGAGGIIPFCGEDSSANAGFSATGGATLRLSELSEPEGLPPFSEEIVSLLIESLPVKDVFRFGYVLSENWLNIWKRCPLVCHDLQFAPRNFTLMHINGTLMDRKLSVSAGISKVLEIHPGPIKILRVDMCTWIGGNAQLMLWLRQIREKRVEILFLAGRWPTRDRLDMLPSNIIHLTNLKKIYLSFLKIANLSDDNEPLFPQLAELHLSYCTFDNDSLRIVLRNCKTITTLSLSYITQKVLSVTSPSLRKINVWKSTIDYLCVGSCPRLSYIHQEMEFEQAICSHMQIRDTQVLHELSFLQLHKQTLEIYGYRIRIQMTEYPRCESVKILGVIMDFSEKEQLALIPSLLKCFPKLRQLIIVRVGSQKGVEMDWEEMLSGIECMETSLRRILVANCLGETCESQLADVFKSLAGDPDKLTVQVIKRN